MWRLQQTAQFCCSALFAVVGLCCLAEENKPLFNDTVELKEVVITDSKTIGTNGKRQFQHLENYAARKLPNLLNEISGVYLKNYGNGQLTSIAVRGTTTSQTEVLWNGVKINSPMLGQSDFALLNVGFHNSIAIQFNQLNSAIGSNIALNNSIPEANTHFEGTIRAGSYGLLESNMNISYGNTAIRGATKVAVLKCNNNFPVLKNEVVTKQANADVLQWALFQQLNYFINNKNEIELFAWYNTANREIPPTLLQESSKARQRDQSLRTMLRWKFKKNSWRLALSSAYLYETLHYTNYLLLANDKSTSHAWRNNANFQYNIKSFHVEATAFADVEIARSAGYGARYNRVLSGFSAKASYYQKHGFTFTAGLRQEFMNTKASPFMPFISGAFTKQLHKHFIGIELTAKRSFRFPTFNDLYWQGSGNAQLQAEKSWNAEIAATYKWDKTITLTASNYYAWISNQIQWTPDVSGNWRPQNLKSVFARGLETALLFSLPKTTLKHLTANTNLSYSYTLSTQTSSTLANDNALGKQVIYVPRHRISATTSVGYYGFEISAFYRYTGMRFISTDNSDALPSYSLLDIEFAKALLLPKAALRFAFRINNVCNTIYQDVAQRAMPPRNFEGTLNIKL